MIEGKVVHCKKEKFDVNIGRPSKWGNPFVLSDPKNEVERQEIIVKYSAWILQQPKLMNSLWELRGKTLGCWCAPRTCHGDVLSYLANDTAGTLRLLVAGSRGFTDYELLCDQIDRIAMEYNDLIIVEGEAPGADLLARRYAEERKITYIPMPALWKRDDGTTDKGAGFKRNENMVRIVNKALYFWDMESPGTKDCIQRAKAHNLNPTVIVY